MTKLFSNLQRNNLNLLVVFFIFGAFALGCNFSVGNPTVSESEGETMALKTLQNLNRAIQRGDFREFQQTEVAGSEKANLTPEKIDAAFANFVRNRIDITPKSGAKINWSSKPEVDGKFLNMKGNYPAASEKTISFQLQYVKDAGDWGLKYIDLDIP